jgi:hypothetical protein
MPLALECSPPAPLPFKAIEDLVFKPPLPPALITALLLRTSGAVLAGEAGTDPGLCRKFILASIEGSTTDAEQVLGDPLGKRCVDMTSAAVEYWLEK